MRPRPSGLGFDFWQFLTDPAAAGQQDGQNDTGPLSYLADGKLQQSWAYQAFTDPVGTGQRDAQNDTGPLSYLADGADEVVTGAQDFLSGKITAAENFALFAVGFGILGFTIYQEIKKHS